jgi:hypothetical protein
MTANASASMNPIAAAAYTGLSVQRLANLRHLGGGPVFCRAGRSVLYLREDLDAWHASLRRSSTSDASAKTA